MPCIATPGVLFWYPQDLPALLTTLKSLSSDPPPPHYWTIGIRLHERHLRGTHSILMNGVIMCHLKEEDMYFFKNLYTKREHELNAWMQDK